MPFEIEGIEELIRNLEKLGKEIDSESSKAVRAGATVIQKEVAARAPEDRGQLKKSIHISKGFKTVNGEVFVEVGPSIGKGFYGPMLEWGTSKMKPKPFFEQAYLSVKDEAMRAVAEVLREALKNV